MLTRMQTPHLKLRMGNMSSYLDRADKQLAAQNNYFTTSHHVTSGLLHKDCRWHHNSDLYKTQREETVDDLYKVLIYFFITLLNIFQETFLRYYIVNVINLCLINMC